MKYKELKEKLNTLSDEQLEMDVVVFENEEEQGKVIDSWDESDEDFYWDGSDCVGNLEMAKESYGDEWEDEKDSLVCVPKGTFSLHI